MSKKIIVTGASGFVAGSIIDQAPTDWEVHAVSRSAAPVERPGLVWHSIDPLDGPRLEEAFGEVRPDAVLHTAAMADIDTCEANPALAQRVNGGLTRDIAELCAKAGARLVYLSTDTVFDGLRGGYTEEDPPGPINVYARTKVEGEEAVTSRLPDTGLVVRTALVMGLPIIGSGNSFLSRMMRYWEEGKPVGVPPSEIRSPIDAITLGQALLEVADSDLSGYLHLAGSEVVDRCEMARRIAERLGYGADLVVPSDPTNIPGRAPRPRDVSLDNTKARNTLKTRMHGLIGGLDLVLAYSQRIA